MFCPKCATENPDKARYCRKCGFQMTGSQQSGTEKPHEDGSDNFFTWVGYIVVGIIVLVGISQCQ